MGTEVGHEYYDKLLIENNVQMNKQRAITIINIAAMDFIGIKINLTLEIQGSVATTMHQFLYQNCNVILVERIDIKEKGKYLLVVYDKDVTANKIKLGKVF